MQNTTARGIILPSTASEAFKPITYQRPVGLLPIVNKPIMEHEIEWFARYGVRNIRISSNHLSNHVEEYFTDGSRWGASLSYNFERPPFGFVAALQQMKLYFENETLVIISSDTITDIDLQAALEFHWSKGADATFICTSETASRQNLSVMLDDYGRIHAVGTHTHINTHRHPGETGLCILEPDVVDILPEIMGHNLLQACWLATQHVRLNLFGFVAEKPVKRITNWKEYHEVQQEILAGVYPGILIAGIQLEPGVWVGKNISVSNHVLFQGPLVIGDNCRIGRGVTLGKHTIIGHDVMVDVGAVLEDAVVFSKTFIGPQMHIRNAFIQGNLMIDLRRQNFEMIEDKLAAVGLERPRFTYSLYCRLNRLMAALLLVLLSPAILVLFITMIVRLRFPLVSRVKRLAPDLQQLAAGKLRLRVFDLVYFGPINHTKRFLGYNPDPLTSLPHLIARLGNLINVVKGDIMVIGNRPMDPEIAFSITEEYRRTRFKCQSGVISILDTNEIDEATEEEQVIAEGYYAVNRTVRMDLGVLLRGAWRYLGRMLGLKKVQREYGDIQQEETPTFS